MSRTRTGLGSDDWRDDGPAAARTHSTTGWASNATIQVAGLPAMRPIVVLPRVVPNYELKHQRNRKP